MTRRFLTCLAGLLACGAMAAEIQLTQLHCQLRLTPQDQLQLTMSLSGQALAEGDTLILARGDAALLTEPRGDGWRIEYDAAKSVYRLLAMPGTTAIEASATFALGAATPEDGQNWRQVDLSLPPAQVRRVEVLTSWKGPDGKARELEMQLPHVLDLQTVQQAGGDMRYSGILRPQKSFLARWQPHVTADEGELLVTSHANVLATLRTGSLELDAVYVYSISQGRMETLTYDLPSSLNVTQVRGPSIRGWEVTEQDGDRRLTVKLDQAQRSRYALRILAEQAVPTLPTDLALPLIQPLEGSRADGYLAVGTNSAIQIQPAASSGLVQIDGSAFKRIPMDAANPRVPATRSATFYTFAATPYSLDLRLSEVVPTYDVEQRLALQMLDDNLQLQAALTFEVRDAPIRRFGVVIPPWATVAAVTGQQVADYNVTSTPAVEGAAPDAPAGTKTLTVEFREPVSGATMVGLQLELGRSPLDETFMLGGLDVQGARQQRGFVALATIDGVILETPTPSESLREVNTRAIPMRVPGAEFAYRFREAAWTLGFQAKRKPASIRAEAFHLVSIGEGVAFGSVVVSYHIGGAPVDELRFRVAPGLEDLEFVGLDVARWDQADGVYTVKLRRKATGAYNLGVTWTQRLGEDQSLLVGGISCEGVDTQTGFVTLASHLSLETATTADDGALFPIGHEEVPEQYRLLVNAPIVASYKYVGAPHQATHTVQLNARGDTPAALVEFMDVRSTIAMDQDGAAESMTRIRYTLKNSSAQFLDLVVPQALAVWTVRQVSINPDGSEVATRLNAARDGDQLKIPLPRNRNPNDPITLELEFGDSHGELAWAGDLALTLPEGLMLTTYTNWQVTAPTGWVIVGGDEAAAGQSTGAQRYRQVLSALLRGWGRTLGRLPLLVAAMLTLLGLLALSLLRGWRWPALGALGLLGALVLLTGLLAVNRAGYVPTAGGQTAMFTQVLTLDAAQTPTARFALLPTWRAGLALLPTAILVALLGLGVWLGLRADRGTVARRLGAAVAAVALLVGLCQFAWGTVLVLYVLSAALPTACLLWLAWRFSDWGGRAAALLLGLLLLTGAAPAQAAAPLDRCDTTLAVAADHVTVSLALQADAATGGMYRIADAAAILLTEPTADGPVIRRRDGGYWLELEAGAAPVTVALMYPLTASKALNRGGFALPLPPYLRGRTTVTVPATDIDVLIGGALGLEQGVSDDGTTTATGLLPPSETLRVAWRPKARQTRLESTVVYADTVSLARLSSGLVEMDHRLQLRVAQGELGELSVTVPAGMSVSQVALADLRAWRFDPETRRLLIQPQNPIRGDATLLIRSQLAAASMPYTAALAPLELAGVTQSRQVLGLAPSNEVTATVATHPRPLNIGDFNRQAAGLPGAPEALAGVTHAYVLGASIPAVQVTVEAVEPELRVAEQTAFSVADDRLVLNSQLAVTVSKAGIFTLDLELPAGYDVDELQAPGLSHWTELDAAADARRRVRVHFDGRKVGQLPLNLALSQPLQALPERIAAPRLQVVGALKHTGTLVVAVARGLRLGVAERQGVTELDVAKMGLREKPALAFKLLGADWALTLRTEVVSPRINVDYLHVAQVSDGLVRHRQILRYRLHNAGVRELHLRVPTEALGLLIAGPEIARKELLDPATGHWRIELTGKWFEAVYPLELSYSTRFDSATGAIALAPVVATGADLQRGYVVVRGSNRVELTTASDSPELRPAEARAVPGEFGAGELADAAFCFAANNTDYTLQLQATRHDSADLLKAEVLQTRLETVVSEDGSALHSVALTLRAGEKRYLLARLPAQARLWSLLVDRQSRTPFTGTDAAGQQVLLIPLPQSTGSDLTVQVDLAYAVPGAGRVPEHISGPRFDLPLRDIRWSLYLPQGYRYDDFGGSLRPVQPDAAPVASSFTLGDYFDSNRGRNDEDLQKAAQLQRQGQEFAAGGNPQAAREAMNKAYNYSLNDRAMNEDARINLRNLMQDQALVGLLQRRGNLENEMAQDEQDQADFTLEDTRRLKRSLTQADSTNLALITNRIIDLQEAAAGTTVQLLVSLPTDGQRLSFHGDMLVEPNADLHLDMRVRGGSALARLAPWGYPIATLLVIALILLALPSLGRAMDRRVAAKPKPARAKAARPAAPPANADTATPNPANTDDEEDSK